MSEQSTDQPIVWQKEKPMRTAGDHIRHPVPLDDLRARLDLLRRYGVREYQDGELRIALNAERPATVVKRTATQGVLCDPIDSE